MDFGGSVCDGIPVQEIRLASFGKPWHGECRGMERVVVWRVLGHEMLHDFGGWTYAIFSSPPCPKKVHFLEHF